MSEQRQRHVVLLAENVGEYAAIVAAHEALARELGAGFCWAVIAPGGQEWSTQALRTRYHASTLRLVDIVSGGTSQERQQALLARLQSVDAGGPSIIAPPDMVLPALVEALVSKRLLSISESARAPRFEIDVRHGKAGSSTGLVVACRRSPFAIPAAVFAFALDKRVVFVDRLDDFGAVERERAAAPGSVVFMGEIPTFTKRFLEALLHWSETGVLGPVPFGVMTGPSVEWLSSVICRLLLHRRLRLDGDRLQEPPDLAPIPIAQMQPMEYYVFGSHGNEMHLLHQGHEVFCGACADRRVALGGFDCEPRCPYDTRVSVRQIPANAVMMLSCDAFTLADGLVPPDYNLLLNLLGGWSTSVIAQYKHVLQSPGLIMLVDALVRSGFSMGEIAVRLNSIARFGQSRDPGYLVWGDPDLLPAPVERRRPVSFSIERGEALEISFIGNGSRVAEIPIPEAMLAEIVANGGTPAVEPLSDGLKEADFYFAFSAVPTRKELSLLLFGTKTLGTGPIFLQLQRAAGLTESTRERAIDMVRRMQQLAVTGVPAEVMHTAEENVLAPLRGAAGYPRLVEVVVGDAIARSMSRVLDMKYREARHLLLDGLLKVMEESRLWISHHYSSGYDRVDLVKRADGNRCPYCGNSTVTWRFDDRVSSYASRHLLICSRCGIIADAPTAPEISVRMEPKPLFVRTREQQVVALRNLTASPLEVTWCMQFNLSKRLGMKAAPAMEDVVLPAGADIERVVAFDCAPSVSDDIMHMHLLAITATFGLHFASQKVVAMVRPDGSELREENRAHAAI